MLDFLYFYDIILQKGDDIVTDQEIFEQLELEHYTKLCTQCDDICATFCQKCPTCGNTNLIELSNKELQPYYSKLINEWRVLNHQINNQLQEKQQQYIPKCPLCQSPNIREIPTIKRGAFGVTFGVLSKTARSQWECLDCGNKF